MSAQTSQIFSTLIIVLAVGLIWFAVNYNKEKKRAESLEREVHDLLRQLRELQES